MIRLLESIIFGVFMSFAFYKLGYIDKCQVRKFTIIFIIASILLDIFNYYVFGFPLF